VLAVELVAVPAVAPVVVTVVAAVSGTGMAVPGFLI
jgi:hypothetical protein